MPFVAVNELEKLLMVAATDPSARPAFYRAVLEEELFIIREGEPPAKRQRFVAQEGMKIEIRAMELQGQVYTPIFSSEERISVVVKEKVAFLGMKGRYLLEIVRGKKLILNPGSEFGKVFNEQEVESMLNGSIFQTTRPMDVGGKQIMLGQPKEYPKHLTEPLGKLFAKLAEVKGAYLAHAFIAGSDQKPHTLIGVEVDGDWDKVRDAVGGVLQSAAKPGEVVDLYPVVRGKEDGIANYLLEKTKAFYGGK